MDRGHAILASGIPYSPLRNNLYHEMATMNIPAALEPGAPATPPQQRPSRPGTATRTPSTSVPACYLAKPRIDHAIATSGDQAQAARVDEHMATLARAQDSPTPSTTRAPALTVTCLLHRCQYFRCSCSMPSMSREA